MFRKKAISLLSLTLLLGAPVMAADLDQPEDDVTRSCSKRCKTFNSLKVCNALDVGGSETVGSNVTVSGLAIAQAFLTRSGTLFRNFGLFSNQAAIAVSGDPFLWLATNSSNVSSGITYDTTTGLITLPTSGFFYIQYSARVRFSANQATDPSTLSVNLSKGSSSSQTPITVATINNVGVQTTNAGVTNLSFVETEITGYAFITTTSSSDNVIKLSATLPSGVTIPIATTTLPNNANAQMMIFQLN